MLMLASYLSPIMNKEAQYLLASVVESSQDSIVTIDLNRNVTSWNKAAERMYGYTADEVIGKPLSVVVLPEDVAALIDKVDTIIHEVTVPIYETVRVLKNGKHSDLNITVTGKGRRGKGYRRIHSGTRYLCA